MVADKAHYPSPPTKHIISGTKQHTSKWCAYFPHTQCLSESITTSAPDREYPIYSSAAKEPIMLSSTLLSHAD